jgi:hypothetical protein
MTQTNLTTTARELHELTAALKSHEEAAKIEAARLRGEINRRQTLLNLASEGLDPEKIALARTILFVRGTYERGGDDRASVMADAIKQLATGEPVRAHYADLWRVGFGTKSYDRWHGQRTDCEYGMGPSHGSLIFQVGINSDVRESRKQADLTPEEIEACIYFLGSLARIQAAESAARAA